MNEDLLKKIYDTYFSGKGSFDAFKSDMQNPAMQEKVWNRYFKDKGPLDAFRTDLGGSSTPQAIPQVEQKKVTVVPAEAKAKPQNKPQVMPQDTVMGPQPSQMPEVPQDTPVQDNVQPIERINQSSQIPGLSVPQQVGGWQPVEKYDPDQALKDAIAIDPGTPFAEKMQAMQQRDEQALNLLDAGMDINDQLSEWNQQTKELDKDRKDINNTVPVSELGIEDYNKRVDGYNKSVQETNTSRIGISRGLEELNKATEESKAFYLGTNSVLKGFYQDVFNKEGGTSVFSQVVEPLFLKWLNDNPGVLRRESTTPNFDDADRVKLASQFISSQIEGLKASEDPKAQRKIDFLKQEMGRILSDHPEEMAKLKRTEERKDNITIQPDDGFLEAAWKSTRQIANGIENALVDAGFSIFSTAKALNDAILGGVGYDVDATTTSDRVYDAMADYTDSYLKWASPEYFSETGDINYGQSVGLVSNTLATMYLLGKTSRGFGPIAKEAGLVASGTMFTVGDAIDQGKEAGLSDKQATYYGLVSGVAQGSLEGFFPEIPLMTLKSASRVALESAAKGLTTKDIALTYFKEIRKHVPGEVWQEITQNWADRGAQAVTNAVTDKEFFDFDPEKIAKDDYNTALITAFATILFSASGNIKEGQKAAIYNEVFSSLEPNEFKAILDGEVLQGNLTNQKAQKMYNSFTQVKQQIAEDNAKEENQLENEQVQAGQEQKSQQQDQQVSQGGQATETGGSNSTVNGEQPQEKVTSTVQQAVPATATGESGVQVPTTNDGANEGATEGATPVTPTETVTATEAVAQGDTAPGRVATEGAVNTGAEQAPVSSVPEQGNTNPVHHTVKIGGELIDLYRDDNGRLRRSDNGAVVDSPALEEAIAVREEQAATKKKLAPWRNGKLSIKNGIKQLLSPSWQRDVVEDLLVFGKKFTNLDKYFGDERADIKKHKTGFVSENGDQIDDYIETVAEKAGVSASVVEEFLTDAIDKIAGYGRRAFVGDMIENEASLSSASLSDTTELGLNDQGEIVEIVDGQPISVESNPPAEERTQGEQVKTSFKFTTSEQRGIRRTVRRLLADPDLDPKLREQIQRDVDAGIYDKDTLTDAEVRTLADQYISAVGLDNAFASVMNDENVPLNVKVQVLNKTAYRLAEQGRILDAAIVFEQLASEGSQLGAALRQFHAGEEDTLLTKAGIRFHVAKTITQKLNQKFGSTNKTKKEVLDEASKLLQADRDVVDEIIGKVFQNEGKVKKSGDDYIKSGLTKIKNALNKPNLGFAQTAKNRGRELAESNRELFEGVLEVVKGLVVKTGGKLTDIKKKFAEFFSNDPDLAQAIPKPDQLFDDLSDLDEFKEAVNKGVVESLLRQHFGGQSTKGLKQLLEDNGITGKDADAIIESTKKAFADTLDVNNPQALTKLGLGPKLWKAMLEKAVLEGKISGDDLLKYFAKQFGVPMISAEHMAVLEQYGDELQKAIDAGGGYKAEEIERKIRETLRRADTTTRQFYAGLVRDIYMANILSGMSTTMRAVWGSVFSNLLGEIVPEMVRGSFEGRSKKLGTSWLKEAAKNMFSPVGFAAGIQAAADIYRFGSVDLSWADTVDLDRPSALDVFQNNAVPSSNKMTAAAKAALRGYMYIPVMMYRNLIAIDAVVKGGVTEFYAYIEAYNKALTQDGTLGGEDLQNEVNRLLGIPKLELIRQEVNDEIKNGITPPERRNLRMRQKLDAYRDEEVSNAAASRAMEALLIGDTYGIIPSSIRSIFAGLTSQKQGDHPVWASFKTGMSYFFPIVRVPLNAVKRMYDFSPLALIEGGLSWGAHRYFGESETTLNKLFNTRAKFSHKGFSTEARSVEDRKRLLWRGAMGTLYGLTSLALMKLLGSFDDPEKDTFIKINGPGTGDYRTNLDLFGQDYKPMTLQIGNVSIDYSDTSMGLGMAFLGYYMDIQRSKKYADKHDMVIGDMMSAMTMGMFNTTFQYSMEQASSVMGYLSAGLAEQTTGKGVDKRDVTRIGRALELLSGRPAQNKEERDFVKTMGSKVSSQFYGNVYKQLYRSYRTAIKDPVTTSNTIQGEIAKYIPYFHDQARDVFLDDMGNPVPERFDFGLPLLSPTYVQELRFGKQEEKNEYNRFQDELGFKDPDFWRKVGEYNGISMPYEVSNEMHREAMRQFTSKVLENQQDLRDKSADEREKELDRYATRVARDVNRQFFEDQEGFPYTIYSIDKIILDEHPSEYDLQIASENLERIKDQLDKYQYRDRKDKLAKLKKEGEL